MQVFTFFDPARRQCYTVGRNGVSACKRSMTGVELESTVGELCNISRFYFVATFLPQGVVISKITPKGSSISDFLNTWNAQSVVQDKHTVYLDIDGTNFIIGNFGEHDVHVFNEYGHMLSLSGQCCCYVPKSIFDVATKGLPYILVAEDVPILFLRAYIYKRGVTVNYFVSEETLVLPAGMYDDLGQIIAMLNGRIIIRGFHFERNGNRLQIRVTHNQPEPSVLEVTALANGIGLDVTCTLPLHTNQRLEFSGEFQQVLTIPSIFV